MKIFNTSLFFLIFSTTIGLSQVTPILTGLNGPWGITIHNEILYVGENTQDRVIKADLTQSTPTSEAYVTGLSGVSALHMVGDTLYIGERNANQISTYNTNDPAGDRVFCTTAAFPPVGLAYRNGSIYVAEREGNKVSRTNVTSGCGSPFNTVADDISQAYGIAIDGDLLYCSDAEGGFVFSINLTDKQAIKDTIITGLLTPAGLLVQNNQLYIAEFGNDRVVLVDNIGDDQVVTSFSVGNGPLAVAADSNDNVYVTEFTANRVSRLGQEVVINETDDLNVSVEVTLYPNPTVNILQLKSSKQFENYSIIDVLGTVVQKGLVLSDNQLNVENLIPGNYYISFDQNAPVEFIKK